MIIPIIVGGASLAALIYILTRKGDSADKVEAKPQSGMPSQQEIEKSYAMAATSPGTILWLLIIRTEPYTVDGPIEGKIVLAIPYPEATAERDAESLYRALIDAGEHNFVLKVVKCPQFTPFQIGLMLLGNYSIFETSTCGFVWGRIGPSTYP